MTIEEAAANVGRRVIYDDSYGRREFGVITSTSKSLVFVRYGHAVNSQGTYPEDLTFEIGGVS